MKYILMPDPFNLGRRYAYALKAHLLSAVKIHIQPEYHNTISKRCQPFHRKTKDQGFQTETRMNETWDTSQVSPGFDWSLESVKDLRNEFAVYRKYPQDRPEKILLIISFKRKPLSFSGFRSWLRSWERFRVRVFAALVGRERPEPKDFTRYQP